MSPPDDLPPVGSPEDWLRYARSDLAVADGARADGALPGVYCYHAQQAAEKAIKAVQVRLGLEPPHRHEIAPLLKPLMHLNLPPEILASAELTEFVVETRYPGAFPDATWSDLTRAVAHAQAVVAWAASLIGKSITEAPPKSGTPLG